jgi:hypothetical protein
MLTIMSRYGAAWVEKGRESRDDGGNMRGAGTRRKRFEYRFKRDASVQRYLVGDGGLEEVEESRNDVAVCSSERIRREILCEFADADERFIDDARIDICEAL